MAKELEYRFKSASEIEALIKELEDKITVTKRELDEGTGYELRPDDRSFEVQVLRPDEQVKNFIVTISVGKNDLVALFKEVFGKPKVERTIAASILTVAELIAKLPKKSSEEEIEKVLEARLGVGAKYNFYKKMILKQAKKDNARECLKEAAKRLE